MAHNYKDDTPLNTIYRIRNILEKIDVLVYEKIWNNPHGEIYSVRVECSEEDGEFGSNGKGRTRRYALASAYAEFIERVENGFILGNSGINRFFMKKIKERCGFYFFPDEAIMSKQEFLNLPKSYLDDIFSKGINNAEIDAYFSKIYSNGMNGMVSVPFYDVANKRIQYFPFSLTLSISGSNGMASGNSKYEALHQALCELVEREASRTIYYERLTPPNIPTDFLDKFPEELRIISEIENAGYKVVVKDFSCGYNLPAIGVLIMDECAKKYRLNVGADTSFKIALSRALTEIYQGVKDDQSLNTIMLNIPTHEYDYFINNSFEDIEKRDVEIKKFLMNGTGVFPATLFGEVPSYTFDPKSFVSHHTYKEDVNALVASYINRGYNIYIRDVSFLGFPCYYVYIPKISNYGKKTYDGKNKAYLSEDVNFDRIEDVFFPTSTLSSDLNRIRTLLDILVPNREIKNDIKFSCLLRLDFKENCDWAIIPLSYFLTIFCYLNKEYKNAEKYLKSFMRETQTTEDAYYNEILNYFALLDAQKYEEIKKNISEEIINSFKEENIFSQISMPNCPNCSECQLFNHCKTKSTLLAAIKIANEMKKNSITQEGL